MRTRGFVFWVVACAVSVLAASPALAGRPAAGQGGIFVDQIGDLSFEWTDVENDFLQVYAGSSSPNDFAREAPNGRRYVHVAESEFEMFATVSGIDYDGSGRLSASYFADCPVFDPAAPEYNCFIGPGPATMNASGVVRSHQTGETCALSAHLAGFFLEQNACEAIFGPGSCPGGAFIVASPSQFDIKVTCPQ